MASASYSQDLTCPICWTIFTDPVTLLCGHSFCRRCITNFLSLLHSCPQCGTAGPTGGEYLPTSHILRSLAEKAKEAEKVKKENVKEQKAEVAELCPDHDEKLRLFCVTDQQLACIVCRDGEKHEGHKFKPIKEAAASLRQELEKGMENLYGDILRTERLANTQREEITKNKKKSQQLMTQICRQFEEMHQFLRKREDEIKNELKVKAEDAVENMRERLNAIEKALSEIREQERKLTSVLKIEDSERLLKSWTECNSRMSPEQLLRPRANDLQVVDISFSLGPYESHLKFFVWKEMLQVIQPRAELLSLKSNSTDITVSDDGRSLFCTPKSNQGSGQNKAFGRQRRANEAYARAFTGSSQHGAFDWDPIRDPYGQTPPSSSTDTHVFSVNEFTSGQHYWEIEVGHRNYWELGIKDNFLKYDGKQYATCTANKTTNLEFRDRPRKIGIYLNCESKKVSFYDADNMRSIHAMSSRMSMPLSAYFNIRATAPDTNPLTVCWY